MDDKARMDGLLRRLKKEMNGVVADAMYTRGIRYPVSYGVSVQAIRDAAKACAPSHAFAALLFNQPVRELKLSAVWVDRPEWVTPEQMETWGAELTHSEITEQVATFLFGSAPDAVSKAADWMRRDESWLRYAALLMGNRALVDPANVTKAQVVQLIEGVDELVRNRELRIYALRAAAALLARGTRYDPAAARNVRHLCAAYASSGIPAQEALAAELSWQIEDKS